MGFERVGGPGTAPGRESGSQGVGARVARAAAGVRDVLAERLARRGLHPDALTVAGLVASVVAGACLARGASGAPASPWLLAAVAALLLGGALDVLDGATARAGGRVSARGAFLDSMLDRISDLSILGGCVVHYAWTGHLTLVALGLLALANAYLISYAKARAENFREGMGVGFWQRGERFGLFLLAALLGNVPAALWLLAVAPAWTVWGRIRRAYRLLAGDGEAPPPSRLVARGGLAYDLAILASAAFLAFGPAFHPWLAGAGDPLRTLFG